MSQQDEPYKYIVRSSSYDKGYEDGYEDGHGEGYDEGYEKGYDEGYEEGCDKGYEEGSDEAREDANFWQVKTDKDAFHIGDKAHCKSWNNPHETLPVVGLGDRVVYLQWGDGDVVGYDPDELEKVR